MSWPRFKAGTPEIHITDWILPSSLLLRSVDWFRTDVSGLPVRPIFKAQSVQEGLRSNQEEGRIQFDRCESLRSRITDATV